MKRLLGVVTALSMSFSTVAMASEVNIALSGTEDIEKNGEYVFIKAFADHLNANGMETKVHPSDSLGKEKERFDQLSQGLIQVNLGNTGVLFKLAPVTKGLLLPFMFSDNANFDESINRGKIIEYVNEQVAPHGIRLAGFPMRGGGMGLFNSKHPVAKIADVADLRLRAKDGVQIKLFEAWGSEGTVVSWAEVSNALQTGVADGYFNPPASALLFGHTSVLNNFTPLNAGPSARVALLSQDWYEGLDDKTRAIVDEAVAKGIAANRVWAEKWIESAMTQLQEQGVAITELEPGQRELFAEASKKIWGEVINEKDLAILKNAAMN
ncbi:TRAP transporter substrate-binding protein [Sneathiella litorea]|uniref:TRAP-type C4-dicarboxylate transport system, substrate-binding protein n=1 Tax=Sneathiella litorea TaxID=2606216 RepID=A0A6L8W797_9PROT|nr:TRAP transporter substrate-binding protein [Sneathiella litorea]MZR30413.1 hypothetical protein [Sneathiella litorea]